MSLSSQYTPPISSSFGLVGTRRWWKHLARRSSIPWPGQRPDYRVRRVLPPVGFAPASYVWRVLYSQYLRDAERMRGHFPSDRDGRTRPRKERLRFSIVRKPARDRRRELKVRVIEIDGRKPVSPRRNRDNPRALCPPECGPEASRELEVPEMIRGKLMLESAAVPSERAGRRRRHRSPAGAGVGHRLRTSPRTVDRGGIEQVHRLDLDSREWRPAPWWPASHRAPITRAPAPSRDADGLPTEAGITARDDRYFSREGDAMDDIGSRRCDTKSGAYRLLVCRHSILGSLILFSEASYFRCFFSISF